MMQMSQAEASDLEFPFPVVESLEPAPEHARLRQDQPVVRVKLPSGDSAWLVTRHADVRLVFSDTRFSRAAACRPGAPRLMPGVEADPESIVSKDPPDHSRLRKLVAPAFTPKRVEGMRARTQEVVTQLLDALESSGRPADFVSGFSAQLPMIVICDLLGVPQQDRQQFRAWAAAMFGATPNTMKEALAARGALIAYMGGMVEAKRANPTDDLLGVLVAFRDEDDRLTERELVSFAGGLLIAGYETTANRLATTILMLLRRPDQLALLQADAGLIPNAVEEALRYVSGGAAGGFMRVATVDVELRGQTIRAGDGVIAVTNAANRDPAVFPEADRFDVTRAPAQHMTFGHGIHYCVGAQLARIELQEALRGVLARFPKLRLAVPESELQWRKNVIIHSLQALPITW
jgi:cytochrome P450